MNNGYPAGAAAAGAPGRLSGGAAAAFYSGGRAAAVLMRGVPYVGAALLAYELAKYLRAGIAAYQGWTELNSCHPSRELQKNGTFTCGAISGLPSQWPGADPTAPFVAYGRVQGSFGIVTANYQRQAGTVGLPQTQPTPPFPALPWAPSIPLSAAQQRPWALAPEEEKAKGKPVPFAWQWIGMPIEFAPDRRIAGYSMDGAWAPWRPAAGAPPWDRPRVIPIPGIGIGVIPEQARPGVVPIAPGAGSIVVPGVGAGVVAQPGVKPVVAPFPVAAFPARPAPGTREVKAQMTAAMQPFQQVFGAPGETSDFIGALHDALPPCRKTRSPAALRQAAAARRDGGWNEKYRKAEISDVQKILDIGRFISALADNPNMRSRDVCRGIGADHHWTDGRESSQRGVGDFATDGAGLNHAASQFMERGVRNLVKNEITDRAYGAVGKRLGSISRELGLPVGVQTMRRVAQFKLG